MPTMRNLRRCSQCERVAMNGSLLCWHCTPPDERPEKGANKRERNRERHRLMRADMRMLGIRDRPHTKKRDRTSPGQQSGVSPGGSPGGPAGALGGEPGAATNGAGVASPLVPAGYDVRAVLWRLARDPKATATARASAARTLAEMDGIIGKHQQAPERISDATLATLSRSDLVQELARLRDRCAKDGTRDMAESPAGQG